MNTKNLDFNARAVLGAVLPLLAIGECMPKELALKSIELLADQITLDEYLEAMKKEQQRLMLKLFETKGRA